jgi:hypothetical protein
VSSRTQRDDTPFLLASRHPPVRFLPPPKPVPDPSPRTPLPDPILRLFLPDGRPATLRLGEASTVLAVGDGIVSSWDLAGRPYALVRESGTYRRGLDGGLLHKREATPAEPRVRRRLSPADGEAVVEAARTEASQTMAVLRRGAPAESPGDAVGDALERLRLIAALDLPALAKDAARFEAASGRVGILPPDQYLALVVRLTEGCSWNACTFCSLYRDVPFRFKAEEELARHLAALRAYFGASLALRRSVFLGDANALCLAQPLLLPRLERVARELPGRPLFSFVDAWTGQRKTAADWRACGQLGLRRVYVGLESADPALLAWLEKPGTPGDAVELVAALHEGGVAAGVIVLLGAGGERFDAGHVARTADTLSAMRLSPDDVVYFSEYVDDPSVAYGRRAGGASDLAPLPPARARAQRDAILRGFRPADPARPPRSATYDLREFVY